MPTLSNLAATAYAEDRAIRTVQQREMAAEHLAQILHYADLAARKTLGNEAAELLAFEVSDGAAEPDTTQAEADIPDHPGYGIRFVGSEDHDRLYLVRPCAHCGHVAVDEVRSLPHLGELLNADATGDPR
ncbi:hypothetical protein [Streptacidiphilus cavernicola]|uniref:Uncharacterized protein n=1 Tax=Streptacidiphilus cavernicola TaxID=3342716 RepID=A0ABV6W4M2_9ACTN